MKRNRYLKKDNKITTAAITNFITTSTYRDTSPISSGVGAPSRTIAVAPKAPQIRLNSNFDGIFTTIILNLSRKCNAISLTRCICNRVSNNKIM